jgi:hypothetical protein
MIINFQTIRTGFRSKNVIAWKGGRLLILVWSIGGHRHRPSCRRYPTSDIDISYSDTGTKYVGLNPHIPISEEFRYRHQLPYRYRTKSISDIQISKI